MSTIKDPDATPEPADQFAPSVEAPFVTFDEPAEPAGKKRKRSTREIIRDRRYLSE